MVRGGVGDGAINVGDGNDLLSGGLDDDTILGMAGKDIFVFNTAPMANTIDHITDFGVGGERVYLAASVFTGLTLVKPSGGRIGYQRPSAARNRH